MTKPLLKWPGGKRWLASKIAPYLIGTYNRYIEPFLGGGAMLFALEPLQGIASDINRDLIACYRAIKHDGNHVLNEFHKLQPTKREYYYIRDTWDPQGEFMQAARLIYLLRHSWNGLYRVNKAGRFNVPFCPRERKDRLTEDIIISAQLILQRVRLECRDFENFISEARRGDLIFADPPYFEDGRETFSRYSSIAFRESDQKRLVNTLSTAERRGACWILTNGNVDQVQACFPRNDIFALARQSSIAADRTSRGKIQEYVVLSNSDALSSLRQFLGNHSRKIPSG